MQIVTGYAGESHITSNDDQGRNQGIFGASSYVLNVGSKFAITTVSANEYQIADGEAVHQGVHFRVDPNSYDTVTIDNGTQGMKRIDLIVARYTKDGSTSVEKVEWAVIKGTEAASSPATPAYTTGDILDGDYTVDMPMYKITLNGVNVQSVTAMYMTLVPMATLQSRLTTAEDDIDTITARLNGLSVTSITINNVTIEANGYTDISETVSRSGYTPLGVVGYAIYGSSACFVVISRITSYGLTMRVKNTSSASVTLTNVSVSILWSKN